MMKRDTKAKCLRLFKVSHQILNITGINFENKSLIGYVELTIWPLKPDLTSLRLNSKQCTIYRVNIDKKWDAEFSYFDPMLDICQGNVVKRNIDYFQKCQLNALNAVDPDLGNGELIITLPQETITKVTALNSFQVYVEFSLQEPKSGLHFVVPDLPGTMVERSAHMFTYAVENFSRLWFPCVDTFSEPCTWKIEVTVQKDMTAVSCGDLVSVELTEDLSEKTYHYFLSSPTAAPNIGLAVGPFEILVDPKMHEVTHFCLPKLMPILKHTTSYIHQAFEFYEELMSSRYPYSYYKQVFVDQAYCQVSIFSTMSVLCTNLLHPPNIIDQTMMSRQLMATAVAQQFFGSFIAMESWCDAWLTKGITGYLSYLFCKKTFGTNEYRNWVMRDLQEVSDYEQQVGHVILDPSKQESTHPFSIHTPHTLSPQYAEVFAKKARLVMRMLEIRIGTELLLQVLNKLLSLAYNASQQPFSLANWTNMLVSTTSFLKIIYTVTGKDTEPFIDLWVYQGGCARFTGNFVFNRKRNVVELDIRQDLTAPGALKFVGALNVTIQELDGSFNHTFKIEENKTKFEITCHSKSRRNKKKKIPLMTGEEVDMDLSSMDQDSPVLWLRLDPDMHLLRTVSFEQPDYMWQYQLKFERCIVAQFEAIEALGRFPTPNSRYALTDTIENEECYYRVRQDACYCLAKIANLMVGTWTGPPAMITIFRKMFGSHSCPFIIRQNNFSNLHHYYLLKTMPQAMARLRDSHNLCLTEVTKFLLDLFKYNDNSRNKWSDNFLRASLVEGLAASITPAVTNVSLVTGQVASAETLSTDTKLIVEEIVRCLNLEKLMPCYRFTVTCSCLFAIRTLQKYGHLPNESDVFKDYAQPGMFRDVRVAAMTCIVDFVRGDISGDHLQWTLQFIEKEQDPYLRHHAVTCLIQNPPFRRSERSALNVEPLVEQLWDLMSTRLAMDSRLKCGVADLYFTLYGRQRPTCLPVSEAVKQAQKDKKTKGVLESEMGSAQGPELNSDHETPQPGVGSQLGAEWTPELSSMFVVGSQVVVEEPSAGGMDEADDDPAVPAVDLTMISGEQTVAMEESVPTEPVVEDGQVQDENVVMIEPEEVAMPVAEEVIASTSRRESVSHLSEKSLASPASHDNHGGHLSEESLSPPRKDDPEDVIVSLDNIINTDPSVPDKLFRSSSQLPPPAATSPHKGSPPSSPTSRPVSPTLGESLKSSPPKLPAAQTPDEETAMPPRSPQMPSPPCDDLCVGREEETASPPPAAAFEREIKLETVEEQIPFSHSPQALRRSEENSRTSPPRSSRLSSTESRTSLSQPSRLSPRDIKDSPPQLPRLYPETDFKASPPHSSRRLSTDIKASPPHVSEPSSTELTDFPPQSSRQSSVDPSKSPSLKRPHCSSSMAKSPDKESEPQEPQEQPSLKTTFILEGSTVIMEGKQRSRSSSQHKAKKKKKKNKHKHKHKHKHDRADKDPGHSDQRPRERLLLDMSASRAGASFTEEQSSSDLEV